MKYLKKGFVLAIRQCYMEGHEKNRNKMWENIKTMLHCNHYKCESLHDTLPKKDRS